MKRLNPFSPELWPKHLVRDQSVGGPNHAYCFPGLVYSRFCGTGSNERIGSTFMTEADRSLTTLLLQEEY